MVLVNQRDESIPLINFPASGPSPVVSNGQAVNKSNSQGVAQRIKSWIENNPKLFLWAVGLIVGSALVVAAVILTHNPIFFLIFVAAVVGSALWSVCKDHH